MREGFFMKFDICVPLLGFEEIKQVDLQRIDDIFVKMQADQEQHVSFTLIDPFVLRAYDFEIPDTTQKLLEIDEKSNILILNIVLIQTPIEDSVVNFVAPLIFNTDNKKAAQIILPESANYSIAEKISTFLQ